MVEKNLQIKKVGIGNKDFPKNKYSDLCTLSGIAAPLWQQAFDWFRNNHDVHIEIQSYHCIDKVKPFGMSIDYKKDGYWSYYEYSGESRFETYEAARKVCLEKVIELVSNV